MIWRSRRLSVECVGFGIIPPASSFKVLF